MIHSNRFQDKKSLIQHLETEIHHELVDNFLQLQTEKTSQALAIQIQQQLNLCLAKLNEANQQLGTDIFAQEVNQIMHRKAQQELGRDYTKFFGKRHTVAHKDTMNIGQRLLNAHYDDILEFAFVAFVNAIVETSQKHKVIIGGNGAINVGKQSASIIDSRKLITQMTEKIKDVTVQEAKKNSLLQSFTEFSQKIDASVGELSFKAGVELNEFEKLAQLLSGHTYTIKNYSETTISKHGVGIGSAAQEFKSLMGTLATLGYNYDERAHIWNHIQNSPKKNNIDVVRHKNHLKLTYELMGTGLIDKGGNQIPVAEFLILQRHKNDSASSVEVYSTAALIRQAIDSSMTQATSLHARLLRSVMNDSSSKNF